jgi:hypothetical protein
MMHSSDLTMSGEGARRFPRTLLDAYMARTGEESLAAELNAVSIAARPARWATAPQPRARLRPASAALVSNINTPHVHTCALDATAPSTAPTRATRRRHLRSTAGAVVHPPREVAGRAHRDADSDAEDEADWERASYVPMPRVLARPLPRARPLTARVPPSARSGHHSAISEPAPRVTPLTARAHYPSVLSPTRTEVMGRGGSRAPSLTTPRNASAALQSLRTQLVAATSRPRPPGGAEAAPAATVEQAWRRMHAEGERSRARASATASYIGDPSELERAACRQRATLDAELRLGAARELLETRGRMETRDQDRRADEGAVG